MSRSMMEPRQTARVPGHRVRHLLVVGAQTLLVAAMAMTCVAACSRTDGGDQGSGAGGGVRGSGVVKTDTRTVGEFTQVALTGQGDVTVTQADHESLTIEAEENLLPELTSIVAGHRLTLGTRSNVRPTKPIRYTVTVKDLAGIDVSGAGKVTASQVHTAAIGVSISGVGSAVLSGEVESESVAISGAGNCDASQLAAKSVEIVLTGTGNAVVQASDSLDARISGLGNVEYIGDPKVKQSVTGLGRVRKH